MSDTQYINKVVVNGQVKIDLTADTVDAEHLLSGYTAHAKSGAPVIGTCTFDADTGDATAAATEILKGKTAYVTGQKVTGTMPNNGGTNVEIVDINTDYPIPRGYHDGSGKAVVSSSEKSKIVPENIRQGVSILGVEGTMSGLEGASAQSKTVTPNFDTQSITPDTADGYNYLSEVVVNPIPVNVSLGAAGGYTLTVG